MGGRSLARGDERSSEKIKGGRPRVAQDGARDARETHRVRERRKEGEEEKRCTPRETRREKAERRGRMGSSRRLRPRV